MPFDPDLPFRVYCVSGGGDRAIVATFARYIEAEVFVHCELREYSNRGTDTGRFWGADAGGHAVHYWIETSQMTASVRNAVRAADRG